VGGTEAAVVQYSTTHTFSLDDIQGGFYPGNTYAEDRTVLCGVPDGRAPACPPDAEQPMSFKFGGGSGTTSLLATLYPIDSEFGFYVTDFVGAAPKVRDDDYGEGWAANIPSLLGPAGLYAANNDTDTFKTKYPTGTWLAGLGSNSVKASTEHYTVLEHVLSCFETIPYFYANPVTGAQGELIDPADGVTVLGDCSAGELDDALFVVKDGVVSADPLLTDPDGTPGLSINGAPLTPDFDLVLYLKGDKKSVAIYDATLILEYDAAPPATNMPLYAGTVFPTNNWQFLDNPPLANPVVFLGPPTRWDPEPGVLSATRNIYGFYVRFAEWDYLDGVHAMEEANYLFANPGRYTLPDGSIWEIGVFPLGSTMVWTGVPFTASFPGKPKVFLTVQRSVGQTTTVRARDVTPSGFEAAMFEQESLNDGHIAQDVSSTGGDTVAPRLRY